MTRNELFERHKQLCSESLELMKAKNQDYGADEDPFRNFREFGALGILVRMSDKLARLRTFTERKEFAVKNEAVEDSVKDIINYAILFEAFSETCESHKYRETIVS